MKLAVNNTDCLGDYLVERAAHINSIYISFTARVFQAIKLAINQAGRHKVTSAFVNAYLDSVFVGMEENEHCFKPGLAQFIAMGPL